MPLKLIATWRCPGGQVKRSTKQVLLTGMFLAVVNPATISVALILINRPELFGL